MNLFLLGATGSTGYEILKRLIMENYKVKVLFRNPEKLYISEFSSSEKKQK